MGEGVRVQERAKKSARPLPHTRGATGAQAPLLVSTRSARPFQHFSTARVVSQGVCDANEVAEAGEGEGGATTTTCSTTTEAAAPSTTTTAAIVSILCSYSSSGSGDRRGGFYTLDCPHANQVMSHCPWPRYPQIATTTTTSTCTSSTTSTTRCTIT